MSLARLVIGRRPLLQGGCQSLDRQRRPLAREGVGLFDQIQQVAPVPIGHVDQGRARGRLHGQGPAFHGLCPLDQDAKPVLIQSLQHHHLTSRQQRPIDLETGILCRGTDERDDAAFDEGQESVLLCFVEPVDFVDEQQGALAHRAAGLGPVEHGPQILHARENGADGLEFEVCLAGQQPGNRRLADTGRPPENDG